MPPLADQTTAAVHLSCLTAATLQLSRVDTAAAAVQCGLGGVLGRGTSGVQGVAVVEMKRARLTFGRPRGVVGLRAQRVKNADYQRGEQSSRGTWGSFHR